MAKPTQEELDDILLSCRFGENDEIKAFGEKYSFTPLADIKDDRGNTVLHMICGNGHTELLELLLPHLPSSLLSQANNNGSPPLHWAVLNNHVACVQLLAEWPEEKGGGLALLKLKNRAGRDAFAEALHAGEGKEEVAGWIEGYLFKTEGGGDDEPPDTEEASAGIATDGPAEEQKNETGEQPTFEAVAELAEQAGKVDLKDGQ